MKKTNQYNLQKNISFLLILFLGIAYTIFLGILTVKALPGFIMQILYIIDTVKHGSYLLDLLTTKDLFIYLIGGFVIVYLLIKYIKSIIGIAISIIVSKIYVNSFTNFAGKDYVLIDSDESLAFTAGLIFPKIYLSTSLINTLSNDEIGSVLLHEKLHQSNYDPLRKLIQDFLSDLLPFMPDKAFIFKNYSLLSELSADYNYINLKGSKKNLLSALNKMLSPTKVLIRLSISNFSFSQDRIKILIENDKFKTKRYFSSITFNISLLFFLSLVILNSSMFLVCNNIQECINAVVYATNDPEPAPCIQSSSSQFHCNIFNKNHQRNSSIPDKI